jgi:hypothetical protein
VTANGQITSTSGKIANWTIEKDYLYNKDSYWLGLSTLNGDNSPFNFKTSIPLPTSKNYKTTTNLTNIKLEIADSSKIMYIDSIEIRRTQNGSAIQTVYPIQKKSGTSETLDLDDSETITLSYTGSTKTDSIGYSTTKVTISYTRNTDLTYINSY